MKEDKREFRHESLQDRESLEEYLRTLTEGFSTGVLRFSDKEGDIALTPSGLISFEVQATKKNDRVRLKLKLTWKDGSGKADTDNGTLRIRSSSD